MLATVSDKRLQVSAAGSTVDYYAADVVSAQDYYPFGMLQPGRSYNAGGYRYGFNGKENDNEVKGEGNSIDFGARVYDSRIGTWFSVDKITKPAFSSYQFAKGNPVNYIDPDGNDEVHFYYYLQDNLDSKGKSFTTISISTQIIENGDKNHTFFIHNQGYSGDPVQIRPFINGTNLPNQSSFSAAENKLPLAPITKYLYGLGVNSTDDYEYLGRLLQIDPSVLEHYKGDNQWATAFNGAKAQAATAKFAKKLVGVSETIFMLIDGYYALKGVFSLVKTLKSELKFTSFEGGNTYAEYGNRPLGYYEYSVKDGLELDLTVPKELKDKGLGTQIFNNAMETTNAEKFTARWTRDVRYEDGMSDNLKQFWEARNTGKSELDAAWSTWSGRQAKKHGFTHVTVSYPNNGTNVTAVFTK